MPFTGHTPESLLPRSDSKNPATTCKGITSTGRPCRRQLKASMASKNNGVLAVVSLASDDDEDETAAAAFFCWQHKDQAEQLTATNAAIPKRQDTRLYPLRERDSIDTLVDRLGVLDVDDRVQPAQKRRKERPSGSAHPSNRPPRRVHRPPTWDRVQGPLMAVPNDIMAENKRKPQPRKKPSFWASLCCGGSTDGGHMEVVRHKTRVERQSPGASQIAPWPPAAQTSHRVTQAQRPSSGASAGRTSASMPRNGGPARKPLGEKPAKPVNKKSTTSETSNLLANIPNTLSPQTTSLLLAELAKPISPHDDEGYIYIFWLTEETAGPPPSSTASTLLAPPTRPEQGRRTSDVLRQYSVRGSQRPDAPGQRSRASSMSNSEKKTILLKIGRANNVHRRMNEWTRQCGYRLSLVRFYPYVSSTPNPSPAESPRGSSATSRRPSYQSQHQSRDQRPADPVRRVSEGVRKVPHAARVERLVHLELGDQRVKKNCEACGKEHREWFEVEATKDGVKGVDEVVRRWVDWAERAGGT